MYIIHAAVKKFGLCQKIKHLGCDKESLTPGCIKTKLNHLADSHCKYLVLEHRKYNFRQWMATAAG